MIIAPPPPHPVHPPIVHTCVIHLDHTRRGGKDVFHVYCTHEGHPALPPRPGQNPFR